uniref:hypothetical protein n=1 Tax=Enterocloster clostridioformis TaxID=1531 RepID=UPI00266F0513
RSNGCKSRIHPAVGRIQPNTKGVAVRLGLKEGVSKPLPQRTETISGRAWGIRPLDRSKSNNCTEPS